MEKDILLMLIGLASLIFGGGSGGFFLWRALKKKAETEVKLNEVEAELKNMEIDKNKKEIIRKEIIDSITKEPSPEAITAITQGFKELVTEHKKMLTDQATTLKQQSDKIDKLEIQIRELKEEIHREGKEHEKYKMFFSDMQNAIIECDNKENCIFFKILKKYTKKN